MTTNTVLYRNQEFDLPKFIDMRSLFNKKVLQLMQKNPMLFGEVMPSKLFSDLCEFHRKLESENQKS